MYAEKTRESSILRTHIMNAATKEFILHFHSLDGVTLGERRKNLYNLLTKTRESVETTSTEIDFSSLQPTTPLEENFKVEALIHFKKIHELLEILKGDNPVLREKILKSSSWFIEEMSENISSGQLVMELFPNISYNTKLKLLNKLSLHLKSKQKADEYFEAIRETYGLYLAVKMLPVCSEDFIRKCFKSNRVEITPRQLTTIITKYPSLTECIFDELCRQKGRSTFTYRYRYVFIYLKQYNFSLFLKLNEKYDSNIRLGSRATNTLIRMNKKDIITEPNRFYGMIKQKQLSKSLKGDFHDFCLNLFPKFPLQLQNRLDDYLLLLRHMPSNAQKLNFISTVFRKKYGKELWDYPEFVRFDLLSMMLPDARETWMQAHTKPVDMFEEKWLTLMNAKESIPLLKEKIALTSKLFKRAYLMGAIVKTCIINQDSAALLDVCRYALAHHCYDHVTVTQKFLTTLSLFNLMQIDGEHWECILQFMEVTNGYCSASSRILEAYVQYCFSKDLTVKDPLIRWMKARKSHYDIFMNKFELRKRCLILFSELIPLVYKDNDLVKQYMTYLANLCSWNVQQPNDKISLFINNDAIKALTSKLIDDIYSPYEVVNLATNCIIFDYKKCEENGLLHAFLTTKSYSSKKIAIFLMRNDPVLFCRYITPIMDNVFCCGGSIPLFIRNLCRYYTHLEIPQKISKISNQRISLANINNNERKFTAEVLSHMDPTLVLGLVASSPPLNLRKGINSDKDRTAYECQQAVLPALRNVIPPSLSLDHLLNFSKGEYIPLIQRSLYSVAQNVAESKLIPFFSVLNSQVESIQKHSIYLTFKVLNKKEVYSILMKFRETSKSPNINKYLFKAVFNFFIRNPDDNWWVLTKQCVKMIDIKDNESFNILSKCRRVPSRYFNQYVMFAWDILENVAKPDNVVEKGKSSILDALTVDIIPELPNELCVSIIEKYLFNLNHQPDFQNTVQLFCCKYLIYYRSVAERDRMKFVYVILKNFKNTSYNELSTIITARKAIFTFVQNFCVMFLTKECPSKTIIETFSTFWSDFLKPHESITEYLYLQFTLMYVHCLSIENLTILKIGEKFADFCNFLNNEKIVSGHIFYKILNRFRFDFLILSREDVDAKELVLIESILKSSSSTSCLELVIALLPNVTLYSLSVESKRRYEEIIKFLLKQSDPNVQMQLHHYLL